MTEQGDEIHGEIGDDADQAAAGKNIKQEKTIGGQASSVINVYPVPPTPPKRRPRKSTSMAATVDERVLYKLNEHDVKLAKLEMYREADQQTMLEYKRSLQEDIVEIKQELKPLFGQGLLANPQPNANKEEKVKAQDQNRLTIRLLTIIAVSFAAGVILFILFMVWLALERV